MLITFEGIDGCGKSTQIEKLKAFLLEQGYDARVFREPGGTAVSEQIRDILLNSREDIHPLTETLLFSAARAQLVATRIRPLLESGAIVILDRFFDSTTAYQGYGRRMIAVNEIEQLNKLATAGLKPGITFYLKMDPELASQRRNNEGEEDRMERSGVDFYHRVSDGFDRIAVQEKRVITLDATQTPETIFQSIITHLQYVLPPL